MSRGVHHPVLLIGLFVLDLLTIHPFADGNGRVVRALTNALLQDAGYGVSTYVSLEQIIANTADDYYKALLESTHGWHEQAHDPWPWLTYFVSTLTTAYDTFESRASSDRSTGTKQDRVREAIHTYLTDQVRRLEDLDDELALARYQLLQQLGAVTYVSQAEARSALGLPPSSPQSESA